MGEKYQTMAKKDNVTYLFLNGNKIAETKTETLNIPDINKTTDRMQFYYRRGKKYFFKGLLGKLKVEVSEPIKDIKRGEWFNVEMTFR